ncbi:hypothetical protein F7725_020986, partial [Dissostichus mawsoni]
MMISDCQTPEAAAMGGNNNEIWFKITSGEKRKVHFSDEDNMCQHGHYSRQCSLNEPGPGP